MPIERLTYRGIADDLEDRIDRGEYPPDERLPSEAELIEMYSVSRSTIVRAVGLLHDRGLTEYVPGVGVFVRRDGI